MSTIVCKTHRVEVQITDRFGRPVKRVTVNPSRIQEWPTSCALLRMSTPQVVAQGERYANGATGRDAFCFCDIEEV